MGGAVDEIKFLPEPVELALTLFVKDELVERPIIAEIPRHAVKARAQESTAVPFVVFGIEVDAGPLRHEERVREGRTEACECRLAPSEIGQGRGGGQRAGCRCTRLQLLGAYSRQCAGT